MIVDESILTLAKKIRAKQISPQELWAECQKQVTRLEPRLNASITQVEPVI